MVFQKGIPFSESRDKGQSICTVEVQSACSVFIFGVIIIYLPTDTRSVSSFCFLDALGSSSECDDCSGETVDRVIA